MAGTPISMSDFKQAILLKKQGVSNRKIAAQLGINKETVNNKFAFIASRGLSFTILMDVERAGPSAELAARAEPRYAVRKAAGVESLNVSVAAGLALDERGRSI